MEKAHAPTQEPVFVGKELLASIARVVLQTIIIILIAAIAQELSHAMVQSAKERFTPILLRLGILFLVDTAELHRKWTRKYLLSLMNF